MLTEEENQRLTRVGPGTPGGELLRRYWQPVLAAGELSADKPLLAIRRLGEDLVIYRLTDGSYGLAAEKCPHRFASLAYGRVDDEGIRCPYHGWKFAKDGRCVEQPAEPSGSRMKDQITQKSYPVQLLGGLLFAYMGPLPAPPLPRWDVLAWENGKRYVQKHSVLDCNWLQCMENSVDPSHLYWLHGRTAHLAKTVDHYEEEHDFIVFDYGIMKKRTTPAHSSGGKPEVDQHPLIFPNTLRHVSKDRRTGKIKHNVQCRVPVDDTHTQVYMAIFEPGDGDHSPADGVAPFEYVNLLKPDGSFDMDQVLGQDAMAWVTQGPIADRMNERLGAADVGLVKYRRMIQQQMELVAKGGIPHGTVPNAEKDRVIEFDVINERIGVTPPRRMAPA